MSVVCVFQFSSQVHPLLLLRRVLLTQQVHLPLSSHAGLVNTGRLQSSWRRQLQLMAPSSQTGRRHVSIVTVGRRVAPARLGGRQGHV